MPSTFHITRATFENRDLSDHHPCEWEVDGLTGVTYNIQFLPRQICKTI